MTDQELVVCAANARKNAYIPYSGFAVGAALLTEDGEVYTGCNIENAAYTPTICAERTAFFKAVSEGKRKFRKIAIVGGKIDEPLDAFCAPCGVCRQVMMEFCDHDAFEIILGREAEEGFEIRKYSLREMLPEGFGPSNLGL